MISFLCPIDKYKIRYGPKTEPMVWKKELEISNSTNPCAKKSQELKFVCTQVYELEAKTTYAFQVKTFILGVSKDRAGSPWSQVFEATTDPIKNITTTILSTFIVSFELDLKSFSLLAFLSDDLISFGASSKN